MRPTKFKFPIVRWGLIHKKSNCIVWAGRFKPTRHRTKNGEGRDYYYWLTCNGDKIEGCMNATLIKVAIKPADPKAKVIP